LNTYVDDNLRLSRWRCEQARKQCCNTEESFESAHL
jgi:hypothetical protein